MACCPSQHAQYCPLPAQLTLWLFPGLDTQPVTMVIFEAYTIDQLNRLLAFSRWVLIVCGIIFILFVLLNQWLASRIANLQDDENKQAQQALRASRTELLRSKAKANELNAELSRFVAPRTLPTEQLDALKKCLSDGPHGRVVIAALKSESDAEAYADQISKLLTESGFEATMSNTVWLQLPVKGLYLCARDVANAPLHAVHIQRCFQTAGLRLRAHEDKKMYADMKVPDDAIIFVIGARE